MAEKLLFVIIDGMGDEPVEELDNKTPLESANKPNMDFLARTGQTGSINIIDTDIAPTSETAVLSLLGYDPFKYFTGRGPLEAFGMGADFKNGDIALRTNLAVIENGKITSVRANDITSEENKKFAAAVNRQIILSSDKVDFKYYPSIGYRGVLVLKSKSEPLSDQISNTHPAYTSIKGISVAKEFQPVELKPCLPKADTKAAVFTAKLVSEFVMKSNTVLDKHEINTARKKEKKKPANVILTREAGNRLPELFSIEDRYKRLWLAVSDMPMEEGIAKLAGMEVFSVAEPDFSDLTATLKSRREIIKEKWNEADCFYVHIKGPDIPSHDKEPLKKREIIEQIDEHFIGWLLSNVVNLSETIVCITADHSSSSKQGVHIPKPVPVVICGAGVRMDTVKSFSENSCNQGSIGLIKGIDLMPMLMKHFTKGE